MMDSATKGNQLFTFVHYLNGLIDEIWAGERYSDEPEHFLYTIIYKQRSLLDTASFLLTNIDGKPHYIDSIALILRTCLLDTISLYFVLDSSEQTVGMLERIEQIMSDHVYRLHDTADVSERPRIKGKYSVYWNSDGSKKYSCPKTKGMIERVSDELLKNEMSGAYQLYDIFSKYEHNGALTFTLLHSQYQKEGHDRLKKIIFQAVCKCCLGLLYTAQTWITKENAAYIGMESMLQKLLQGHPE